MSFILSGKAFTKWTRLTDTSETTVFSATGKTTIVDMRFKHHGAGTPNLTVLRDDGTNDHYFRNAEAVTNKQEVAFDQTFTLNNGDTIKATSSAATGDFHCRITYLAPDATAGGDHH